MPIKVLNDVASGKRNCKLDDCSIDLLQSIVHFLVHAKPRVISLLDNKKPVCLFTDASYENGVALYGMVLFFDGKALTSKGQVPTSLVDDWRKQGIEQVICQAELYPVVLSKHKWKTIFQNRRTIIFIDNDAARFGLIKMNSPSASSYKLIQLYYQMEA